LPFRLLIAAIVSGLPCLAQTTEELFSAKLLPALERDCQGCHGPVQALSKLDVSTREGLLKGGARGPAIVPGNAAQSLLVHVLEGRDKLQMPPGGESKKLPADMLAAFRTWVDAGAPWPQKKAQTAWGYKAEDLWAFQPLLAFDDQKRLDDFIQARLSERGIGAAPKADRLTLIRRVTIDLTGLPPTPDEVDAFVNDKSR
jgi:hypothetical protein